MTWAETEISTADGTTLTEYRWPGNDPWAEVVVLHGIAEHQGRYDHVAVTLNEAGIGVRGIDLRGHGRSPVDWSRLDSYERWLDDLADHVEATVADSEVPVFAVGHSLGGCHSLTLAGTGRLPVRGLVTSGAAVRVSDDVSAFARVASRAMSRLRPGLGIPVGLSEHISRDPAVVADYESDPLVHQRIPARIGAEGLAVIEQCESNLAGVDLPLLALHGSSDHLTDPDGLATIEGHVRSEDATFRSLDGWYHELFHEPDHDELVADVVAWMRERV